MAEHPRINDESNNPYRPPGSGSGGPVEFRRGHPLKAIALGALADVGGTVLVSAVVTLLFVTMLMLNGVPEDGVADQLGASRIYLGVIFVLGLGLDVVGGYVAARIANHAEYKHAILTAVVVVIAGIVLTGGSGEKDWPGWLDTFGIAMAFPSALLGARLYLLERHRATHNS